MERLTEKQICLIELLKTFQMETPMVVATVLALETERQQYQLVKFLAENQDATQNEILEKALEIHQQIIKY